MLVVPVGLPAPNSFGPLGAVVSAHRHTVGGWVSALVTPCLALSLAPRGVNGDDVGQRHAALSHTQGCCWSLSAVIHRAQCFYEG